MPSTNGKYTAPAWADGSAPALNAAELSAMSGGIELGEHAYGVCATEAGTAAKVVAIDYSGTLSLFAGLAVTVKFSYANTAAAPSLNVNGTGAKPVLFGGAAAGSGAWSAGAAVAFVYDGANWCMAGPGKASTSAFGATTLSDAVDSASSDVAATSKAVKAAYDAATAASTAAANAASAAAGKADKAKQVEVTLSASWSGSSAPYTQSVSVAGATANSIGFLDVAQSATAAQREAARAALLYVTAQGAGTMTVTADGEAPTVAIPCVVTLLG